MVMNATATGERRRMIAIDDYVVDTLMRDLVGHDRQPSAFLVYLWLWRAAGGQGAEHVKMSLREIPDGTGLSRRAVQDALGRLHRRRLIGIERDGMTAIPQYTVHRPWADT
jgi:hypothetical protein